MMQVDAQVSYQDGVSYAVSCTGIVPDAMYRARLFLEYTGLSSFSVPGYGLYAEGAAYDDWDSAFRPARVDDTGDGRTHTLNFNTEILAPLDAGAGTIQMKAVDSGRNVSLVYDYNLKGASVLQSGTYTSPSEIIVESCQPEDHVQVSGITYASGTATVTTVGRHPFSTGDAITIAGMPVDGLPHVMGVSGERYNGTFTIVKTGEFSFTYSTTHYGPSANRRYENLSGVTAEKWTMCILETTGSVSGSNVEDTSFKVSMDVGTLIPGDYVSLVSDDGLHDMPNVSVLSVSDDSITVSCSPLPVSMDGNYTVKFVPRLPSASIPANFPIDPETGDVVGRMPAYAHTVNTFMSSPVLDTWFSAASDMDRSSSNELTSSGTAVICMKFATGFNPSSADGGAELSMYVKRSGLSTCTLALYQMTGGQWDGGSGYSRAVSLTGNNVIATYGPLENLSMDAGPLGLVKFHIPGEIVSRWLSGDQAYPPSVALRVLANGNGEVVFNSVEADSFGPRMTISGGSKAVVDPELVDISVGDGTARQGQVFRIGIVGEGTFGDYTYTKRVVFADSMGNTFNASVVGGTPYRIDAIVPEIPGGNYTVTVYSSVFGGPMVQISEPAYFYVEGGSSSRRKTLAAKLKPGVRDENEVNRSAIYNRDLGYSNFSEITDGNSLIQDVYSTLLTRRGERLFNPDFGTTIEDRIFSLRDPGSDVGILQECIKALKESVPLVKVVPSMSSVTSDGSGNAMMVNLAIVLPGDRREILHLTFRNHGTL